MSTRYATAFAAMLLVGLSVCLAPRAVRGETIDCNLLIAGATESGWAAAIQAARLGVDKVVIVHDGEWYGGQFTEQALACVDENKGMDNVGWGVDWHPMKRAFHRSGLFKELMDRIEAVNEKRYGSRMPGKPWHGPSTFRPAEAEAAFREMIQPWVNNGAIRVIWNHYPVAAAMEGKRLASVSFARIGEKQAAFKVRPQLTIDATDWGEVIQLSGTAYDCGPDPHERYGEPSAPEAGTFPINEMNPITWAMIVEETDGESPIARPQRFDDRNYPRATGFSRRKFGGLKWDIPNPGIGSIGHWPAKGEASKRQLTVYSVRRIVDGFSSRDERTSILLNYMNGQDYPLERLPQPVVDALEAIEPGASKKNIVQMTRDQRQIIFNDAKQHALGVLFHLQNFVHQAATDRANTFRRFQLSREFGTSDHLPPKPYIREGLRLRAMYMMREQDGRNRDGVTKTRAKPRFSAVPYPDGLFPWQFHYDFHRTGRTYLRKEGASGPWIDYHKTNRHTKFISDRCVFPLRSLVPEETNSLLGAQGNVGFSSIVSAAIRLHDQRIHIGQAAGATAAVCLRQGIEPREIPYSRDQLEAVRHAICGESEEATPLMLWGFRDLPAEHPNFVAINRLAALGVLPIRSLDVDFRPDAPAKEAWASELSRRARTPLAEAPRATDTTRGQFCQKVWSAVQQSGFASFAFHRHSPTDADWDGIPDHDDAMLFTANKAIEWQVEKPILIIPPPRDGQPDARPSPTTHAIDFCGIAKPAEGYRADRGQPFDVERGFGWRRDRATNYRKRGQLSGARDSFIFTRQTDVWEFQIPNGSYRVTTCIGDSGHEQLRQSLSVEGHSVVDRETTGPAEFIESTTLVNVTDGALTIKIGSGEDKSNTCLNWIHIDQAKE